MLGLTLAILAIAFAISLAYRLLVNPEEVRAVREKIQHYRKEADRARKAGDEKKAERFLNEMLKESQKQFTLSFKPMMISALIFFLAIPWISSSWKELVIYLPLPLPFVGNQLNWFGWYILLIIPAMQIFRKLLGVE